MKQCLILPEPPGGLITKDAMTGTPTEPFVGVVHLPGFIGSRTGERVLARKTVLALIVLLVCPLSRGTNSVQVILGLKTVGIGRDKLITIFTFTF